jgi:hypothetical protein
MLPVIHRGHEQGGFLLHGLLSQTRTHLVRRLPGNARSDDARYACIVPVRDYHRMASATVRPQGGWHYSDLEPEILADIRAGRAVVVLDLTNEGPAYVPRIFDELYKWVDDNALPAGRVVWLAQNRAMAEKARAHAGMRSNLVRFEYHDFFVRAMAWLFSGYCEDPLLGRDADRMSARLLDAARKDKLLLCLNATPRLHRVLSVAALLHNNLIEESLVSFAGLQYVKEGDSIAAVTQFVDANPRLQYLRPALEQVQGMADLRVDSFDEKGNALFAKVDPAPYERSFFSLVTESDFSDGMIDRVSEKIAKAYAMGHPSLVMGNPGSVKFMTELGFRDWNDVLDRSGEAQSDPAARFEMVFREVLRQAAQARANPQAWVDSVREVADYNIRHAMGGGMFDAYVAKYDAPLVARLKALVSA